jgi:hypothetical protein
MSDEDEDGSDDEEEGEEEDEETEDVNQDDKVFNGKSIVRIFMEGMTGDEETLLYPDQVEQVASFYEQRDLGELETKAGQDRKFVALLDDRNICGAVHTNCGRSPCTGHSRPHLGPLTPERLSKELERKVALTSYSLHSSEKLTQCTAPQTRVRSRCRHLRL